MPGNDNILKEQENCSGEALREPRGIKKEGEEEKSKSFINIVSIPVTPNNSDSLIVAKEIEIEGREEQLLKQSLGIC